MRNYYLFKIINLIIYAIIFRQWPMPVQIDSPRKGQCPFESEKAGDWSPETEQHQLEMLFGVGLFARLSMPIITPGYPRQNAAFNVNPKTAKIIQIIIQKGQKQFVQ